MQIQLFSSLVLKELKHNENSVCQDASLDRVAQACITLLSMIYALATVGLHSSLTIT